MAGEYSVKVTVRNALILRRMKELGIKSQTELARLAGIHLSSVNALIAMRRAPISSVDGQWLQHAFAISSALQVEPEELWTERQRGMALRRNSHEINMSEEEVQRLSTDGGVERLALAGERRGLLDRNISKLQPREQHVLRRTFFEGATLTEVADDWGVSVERARQVEAKALRKLKHPSSGLYVYYEEQTND
jgi:DNA-binding CsgD family transcriptional regulator